MPKKKNQQGRKALKPPLAYKRMQIAYGNKKQSNSQLTHFQVPPKGGIFGLFS